MGTRNPFDAFLCQDLVEHAPGAAVAVQHEDALVVRAGLPDLGAHRFGNALRRVVQVRGQAGQLHVAPAVQPDQRQYLTRERAAGDQESARRSGRHHALALPQTQAATCAGAWLCRLATNALAVSTATAASRQYASAPIASANASFSGAPPTRTM